MNDGIRFQALTLADNAAAMKLARTFKASVDRLGEIYNDALENTCVAAIGVAYGDLDRITIVPVDNIMASNTAASACAKEVRIDGQVYARIWIEAVVGEPRLEVKLKLFYRAENGEPAHDETLSKRLDA
jgi:hypothetical protein